MDWTPEKENRQTSGRLPCVVVNVCEIVFPVRVTVPGAGTEENDCFAMESTFEQGKPIKLWPKPIFFKS